jgi:hypothetical protein
MIWQCKWSPTIGRLEATHQEVWGTDEYIDDKRPTVFFGLYGLPDFYALWRHKGKRAILWAGSDIRHFRNGYWLDEKGEMKLAPAEMAKWINKNCESWCENKIERDALRELGIEAKICPSFLGDVEKFKNCYKHSDNPKVYTSVSGDNFEMYGWDKIVKLAKEYQQIEFHLYGQTLQYIYGGCPNIIEHYRIPKEQMNAEIKEMQGALRLTEFDGFSEILAKSLLWGQWPISLIPYPYTLPPERLGDLINQQNSNFEGRKYYLKTLNNFPWNRKK